MLNYSSKSSQTFLNMHIWGAIIHKGDSSCRVHKLYSSPIVFVYNVINQRVTTLKCASVHSTLWGCKQTKRATIHEVCWRHQCYAGHIVIRGKCTLVPTSTSTKTWQLFRHWTLSRSGVPASGFYIITCGCVLVVFIKQYEWVETNWIFFSRPRVSSYFVPDQKYGCRWTGVG